MPSLAKSDLGAILKELKKYPVILRKIPDIVDLTHGKITLSDLKRINIADLLHRKARTPNKELLVQDTKGKNILITGAGGSIGSELCRQIARLSPKRLILFEINEFSLYKIEKELSTSYVRLNQRLKMH